MFKALLIFDTRSREKYEDKLTAIVHNAGGHLETADISCGTEDITERFDKLVGKSDVILIDITVPNTNTGIEIGKHLLHKDERIIVFFCVPPELTIDRIPFYLRGRDYFQLDPNKSTNDEPNKYLLEQIKKVGEKHFISSLKISSIGPTDDDESSADDKVLNEISDLSEDYVVFKSPATAFLFGEFAVTVGHPALSLPLPLYIYVAIRALPNQENIKIHYFDEINHKMRSPLHVDYLETIKEALSIIAPESPPLDILVWSQAPTMCGLGTSSAISASIAKYLEKKGYLSGDENINDSQLTANVNLLGKSGALHRIFKTAWKIDLCFHGMRGSGCGTFATLAGTESANPVLYYTAARKMLKGEKGSDGREIKYSWEMGDNLIDAFNAIENIPCCGFRLSPDKGGSFKPYHFALVYTGHRKSTGYAMTHLVSMSRYIHDSPKMVKSLVKTLQEVPEPVRYELETRRSETYLALIEENPNNAKNRESLGKRHSTFIQEALLTAYGSASMIGINSYMSKNDFSYLALMEACQCILESLGVTRHEKPTTSWEPYFLAQILNSTKSSDGSRVFGAKITGGGMGGDLIVTSNLNNKNDFEKTLNRAILQAKEQYKSDSGDFCKIHYSSTQLSSEYPNGYVVKGTHIVEK